MPTHRMLSLTPRGALTFVNLHATNVRLASLPEMQEALEEVVPAEFLIYQHGSLLCRTTWLEMDAGQGATSAVEVPVYGAFTPDVAQIISQGIRTGAIEVYLHSDDGLPIDIWVLEAESVSCRSVGQPASKEMI